MLLFTKEQLEGYCRINTASIVCLRGAFKEELYRLMTSRNITRDDMDCKCILYDLIENIDDFLERENTAEMEFTNQYL